MEYALVENIEYKHWNSSLLEKAQFQFTGVFHKGKYLLFKNLRMALVLLPFCYLFAVTSIRLIMRKLVEVSFMH